MTVLTHSTNRRTFLKGLVAGSATLALGGPQIIRHDARSTDTLIVRSEGSRLRSRPETGYSVELVPFRVGREPG